MDDHEALARRFEGHRAHLRAVASRILGSETAADDAVQEAWLRLAGAEADEIDQLRAWLTTVVARVSLDLLRARRRRREEPLDRLPDPVVSGDAVAAPEQDALVGDAVGLALLVVLDALAPAERLAFVLHDLFGVSFAEIAPIVERTPDATRQLASRARRRVRSAAEPERDPGRQRELVGAFLAATRDGDLNRLMSTLAPDVVLREDFGAGRGLHVHRGRDAVARQAATFAAFALRARPATVNGTPGLLAEDHGEPLAILAFTVGHGRLATIDVLADPDRLRRIVRTP